MLFFVFVVPMLATPVRKAVEMTRELSHSLDFTWAETKTTHPRTVQLVCIRTGWQTAPGAAFVR
jgi:hypothetical protein